MNLLADDFIKADNLLKRKTTLQLCRSFLDDKFNKTYLWNNTHMLGSHHLEEFACSS